MVRGTTVRFVFTALSAVLLALQLFAPTASFASAHSTTHVSVAKASGGFIGKRADEADEVVTCGDIGHPTGPTGPLRTRDRHRTATDTAPEPSARALSAYDATTAPPEAARAAPYRTARSSTSHTPAALQVFRC